MTLFLKNRFPSMQGLTDFAHGAGQWPMTVYLFSQSKQSFVHESSALLYDLSATLTLVKPQAVVDGMGVKRHALTLEQVALIGRQ